MKPLSQAERVVLEALITTPLRHDFDGRSVQGLKSKDLNLHDERLRPQWAAALTSLRLRGLVFFLASGSGLWVASDPTDARDLLDGRGVYADLPNAGPRLRPSSLSSSRALHLP
jgi:hypothetical protein